MSTITVALSDEQEVVLSQEDRLIVLSAFDEAIIRMYELGEGYVESHAQLAEILGTTFKLLYAAFRAHSSEIREVSSEYHFFGPSILIATGDKCPTIETFTNAGREELIRLLGQLKTWELDPDSL